MTDRPMDRRYDASSNLTQTNPLTTRHARRTKPTHPSLGEKRPQRPHVLSHERAIGRGPSQPDRPVDVHRDEQQRGGRHHLPSKPQGHHETQ